MYALPALMAVANKSALATMCLCAFFIMLSSWTERRSIGTAIRELTPRPSLGVGVVAALVGLAVLSLAWSIDRRDTLFGLGESAIALAAGYVVVAGIATYSREVILRHLCIAVIICASLVMLELTLNMPLRRIVGMRLETPQYNRAIETATLYAAPLIALLIAGPRFPLAWAAVAATVVATLASDSSAGAFALCIAAATAAIATLNLALARRLGLGVALLLLATAPFFGNVLAGLASKAIESAMHGAHVEERVAIWRAYGHVALKFPWTGTGFASSSKVTELGFLSDGPPDIHALIATHPHHAFLQIWVELGVAGVILAAGLLWAIFRGIGALERDFQIASLTLLSVVGAIALTSHSVWQGAWMASVAGAIAMTSLVWRSARNQA